MSLSYSGQDILFHQVFVYTNFLKLIWCCDKFKQLRDDVFVDVKDTIFNCPTKVKLCSLSARVILLWFTKMFVGENPKKNLENFINKNFAKIYGFTGTYSNSLIPSSFI